MTLTRHASLDVSPALVLLPDGGMRLFTESMTLEQAQQVLSSELGEDIRSMVLSRVLSSGAGNEESPDARTGSTATRSSSSQTTLKLSSASPVKDKDRLAKGLQLFSRLLASHGAPFHTSSPGKSTAMPRAKASPRVRSLQRNGSLTRRFPNPSSLSVPLVPPTKTEPLGEPWWAPPAELQAPSRPDATHQQQHQHQHQLAASQALFAQCPSRVYHPGNPNPDRALDTASSFCSGTSLGLVSSSALVSSNTPVPPAVLEAQFPHSRLDASLCLGVLQDLNNPPYAQSLQAITADGGGPLPRSAFVPPVRSEPSTGPVDLSVYLTDQVPSLAPAEGAFPVYQDMQGLLPHTPQAPSSASQQQAQFMGQRPGSSPGARPCAPQSSYMACPQELVQGHGLPMVHQSHMPAPAKPLRRAVSLSPGFQTQPSVLGLSGPKSRKVGKGGKGGVADQKGTRGGGSRRHRGHSSLEKAAFGSFELLDCDASPGPEAEPEVQAEVLLPGKTYILSPALAPAPGSAEPMGGIGGQARDAVPRVHTSTCADAHTARRGSARGTPIARSMSSTFELQLDEAFSNDEELGSSQVLTLPLHSPGRVAGGWCHLSPGAHGPGGHLGPCAPSLARNGEGLKNAPAGGQGSVPLIHSELVRSQGSRGSPFQLLRSLSAVILQRDPARVHRQQQSQAHKETGDVLSLVQHRHSNAHLVASALIGGSKARQQTSLRGDSPRARPLKQGHQKLESRLRQANEGSSLGSGHHDGGSGELRESENRGRKEVGGDSHMETEPSLQIKLNSRGERSVVWTTNLCPEQEGMEGHVQGQHVAVDCCEEHDCPSGEQGECGPVCLGEPGKGVQQENARGGRVLQKTGSEKTRPWRRPGVAAGVPEVRPAKLSRGGSWKEGRVAFREKTLAGCDQPECSTPPEAQGILKRLQSASAWLFTAAVAEYKDSKVEAGGGKKGKCGSSKMGKVQQRTPMPRLGSPPDAVHTLEQSNCSKLLKRGSREEVKSGPSPGTYLVGNPQGNSMDAIWQKIQNGYGAAFPECQSLGLPDGVPRGDECLKLSSSLKAKYRPTGGAPEAKMLGHRKSMEEQRKNLMRHDSIPENCVMPDPLACTSAVPSQALAADWMHLSSRGPVMWDKAGTSHAQEWQATWPVPESVSESPSSRLCIKEPRGESGDCDPDCRTGAPSHPRPATAGSVSSSMATEQADAPELRRQSSWREQSRCTRVVEMENEKQRGQVKGSVVMDMERAGQQGHAQDCEARGWSLGSTQPVRQKQNNAYKSGQQKHNGKKGSKEKRAYKYLGSLDALLDESATPQAGSHPQRPGCHPVANAV